MMIKLFFHMKFYIFLFSLFVWVAEISLACPSGCDCQLAASNICIINCSSTDLKSFQTSYDLISLCEDRTVVLDLSNNQLDHFGRFSISGIERLTKLYLHGNQLQYFDPFIFNAVNLTNITLSDNKWICNCESISMKNWLKENQMKVDDISGVMCSHPESFIHQNILDVDLNKAFCARDFVSCIWNRDENKAVPLVWEHCDVEKPFEKESCNTFCFQSGYMFASRRDLTCICGSYNHKNMKKECQETCVTSTPATICDRKVIENPIYRASLGLRISDLRPYSQYEMATFTLAAKRPLFTAVTWYFGINSAPFESTDLSVKHKFPTSGSYKVSAIVQSKRNWEKISFPVKVMSAFEHLVLDCPSSLDVGEAAEVQASVQQGSSPYISWYVERDGKTIRNPGKSGCGNENLIRDGICSYFEEERSCFRVIESMYSWEEAESFCRSFHSEAHLATIDDSRRIDFISTNLTFSSTRYWIGFNDRETKGNFISTSGWSPSTSPWGLEQPDERVSNQPSKDCVYLGVSTMKWFNGRCGEELPSICQYPPTDELKEPRHLVSGSVLFRDDFSSAFNLSTSDLKFPDPDPKLFNYVLLFPGLWIFENSKLNGWEAVLSPNSKSQTKVVNMMLYRPNCNTSFNLLLPGCENYPIASCSLDTCQQVLNQRITCPRDQYFCPLSADPSLSCRNLTTSCNPFIENDSEVSAYFPSYRLIANRSIEINEKNVRLYQSIFSSDDVMINKNDVIAVGFQSRVELSSADFSQLPLVCEKDETSSWRQNAIFFAVTDFTSIDKSTSEYQWISDVRCDLRLHHSQPSVTKFNLINLINHTKEGSYDLFAAATNVLGHGTFARCEIDVHNKLREVILVYPKPARTEDDVQIVYVPSGRQITLIFQAVGGNDDDVIEWDYQPEPTLRSAGPAVSVLGPASTSCESSSLPNCSRTAMKEFQFKRAGSTSVTVTSRSTTTVVKRKFRTISLDEIEGAEIRPANLERLAKGIQQIFTSYYVSGSDVITEWYIDDLTQYRVIKNSYNVVFRKEGIYKLTMILRNSAGSVNRSIDIHVEKLRMSKIEIESSSEEGNPIEINSEVDIKAHIQFDRNPPSDGSICYITPSRIRSCQSWSFNDSLATSPTQSEILQTLNSSVLLDEAGDWFVHVRVNSSYRDVSKELMIDVRSPIRFLRFDLIDPPSVDRILEFEATVNVSLDHVIFTVWWSDDEYRDPEVFSDPRIFHEFESAGLHDVTIRADNEISGMNLKQQIRIYNRLTGFLITSDEPNEEKQETEFRITADTGFDSIVDVLIDFGHDLIPNKELVLNENQTFVVFEQTYPEKGNYNVTATASNRINDEKSSHKVVIFAVEILSVEISPEIFRTFEEGTLDVVMLIKRDNLFRFKWYFGETMIENIGKSQLQHTFKSSGIHEGRVTVVSLASGVNFTKRFSVEVEDPVQNITLTPLNVVETNKTFTLGYTVSGGSNVRIQVEFGDGFSKTVDSNSSDSRGDIKHIYSEPGAYSVLITCFNSVSRKNKTIEVKVQDRVSNLVLSSSASSNRLKKTDQRFYVVIGRMETYRASYLGTNVTVRWEFESSSVKVGDEVSFMYNNTDDRPLKVRASNWINDVDASAIVEIRSPVKGTKISDHKDLILVDKEIIFEEEGSVGAENFHWMINPPQDTWDHTGRTFLHQFSHPGHYTILLCASNSADSQNITTKVAVISPLLPLIITINDARSPLGVAVNEVSSIKVLQDDGSSIFATGGGYMDHITIKWTISSTNLPDDVIYTDLDAIQFTFPTRGSYQLVANVSNQVSMDQASLKVQAERLIGNITLTKTNKFSHVAAVHEKVVIEVMLSHDHLLFLLIGPQQATVTDGSGIQYLWKVSGVPNATQDGSHLFVYTFTKVKTYQVHLTASNVIGNRTASYKLIVHHRIGSTSISVDDRVVKDLFVKTAEAYRFEPVVKCDDDVIDLLWTVWNETGLIDRDTDIYRCDAGSDSRFMRKFSWSGTFELVLNASNSVSYQMARLKVTAENPILDASIIVSDPILITGSTSNFFANITTEADLVDLIFKFGDGSDPEKLFSNILIDKIDELHATVDSKHVYRKSGIFIMSVTASNNVSSCYDEVEVIVRDRISGLEILGCCDKCFKKSTSAFNLSATTKMGTNVTYTWKIINNDLLHEFTGHQIPVQFFKAGTVEIEVIADNKIGSLAKKISFTVEDPLEIEIKVMNEDAVFVGYDVTFIIKVLKGGSPLMTYDFGDGDVITNITRTTIKHIYISPGDHQVKVTAHNNVSTVVEHDQIYVNNLLCVRPLLSYIGGDGQQFYRSRELYLEISIETNNCRAYNLQYKWKMYNQSSCEDLLLENEMILPGTPSYPLLSLASLTLEVGNYCVITTASYSKTPLTDSINTTIEVVSTPLAAVISGGTYRIVSNKVDVIFNASSSFDPDLEMDQQTELEFEWSCSINSSTTLPGDDGCFETTRGATVTRKAGQMLPGIHYNITMTTWKSSKAPVSTWQNVLVVVEEVPTVTIACTSCRIRSTLEVSSSHQLVLQGSSSYMPAESNFTWTAIRRNISDGISKDFVLNMRTTTTGPTGRYLVVRTGKLLPFFDYEFTLKVSAEEGIVGSSKLVLHANKPPSGGICKMEFDDDHVYVLETLVRFSCFNWSDESLAPLVYSIIAIRQNGHTSDDNFVLYKGTSPTYETYLPLGLEHSGTGVQIQVLVEDELGTFNLAMNRTIEVHLRSEDEVDTIKWLENKTYTDLLELQRASDPQIVADFITGLVTVLNQNSENLSNHASNREKIRNDITRTITSLNTNTFDEIRQVSAVFKQCLRVPSELQDVNLQETGVNKLQEIAVQIRAYNIETSESRYLAVINDLMDSVSLMIDSVNYHVYVTGRAEISMNSTVESVLSEEHRKEMLTVLMDSVTQLSNNLLLSKVEGEEATYINTTLFSSYGKRTTTTSMNSTLINDGCMLKLPTNLFESLDTEKEIIFLFLVSQQNPFTYGYLPSEVSSTNGVANISTRVPSLQIKLPSLDPLTIKDLKGSSSTSSPYERMIKLVMAPSNRRYISSDYESSFNSVVDFSIYTPRNGVTFSSKEIKSKSWKRVDVLNSNSDEKASAHIMVIYEKLQDEEDATPFIDVYLSFSDYPNEWNFSRSLQLTEDTISEFSNHLKYTFYLEPINRTSTQYSNYFLNITNRYSSVDVKVSVGIYYSSCQYFNNASQSWDNYGLETSPETTPSVAICYSNHLTSFGSFVISPPNLINFNEITNVDVIENPVALILISVIFAIYVISMIICRRLDCRDLEKIAMIPLCGRNGSFKYEVTVKTSSSLGSGTSANIGIRVYGSQEKSDSVHLYNKGAFQRGSVDSFYIASEVDLGEIRKIQIWHDNTGLDPAWNVSRVMVKDIERNSISYFLIDMWLQVYPDDEEDVTCLKKVIHRATEEELQNFSKLFGTHISNGWKDNHLWWSLIEHPQRSTFTRMQRLTCAITLVYSFMAISSLWYQDFDGDGDEIGIFRWKDIAVGAIISVFVFPLNIIIVLLFKKSKVELNLAGTWRSRMPTAETVELLDEIDPRINDISLSEDEEGYKKDDEDAEIITVLPTGIKRRSFSHNLQLEVDYIISDNATEESPYGSKDTGFSSGSVSENGNLAQLRRRHGGCINEEDLGQDISKILSSSDVNETICNKSKNLRRTQNTKFEEDGLSSFLSPMSVMDEAQSVIEGPISPRSVIFDSRVSIESSQNELDDEEDIEPSEFLLPHIFIYFAYFLCFTIIALSAFVIILKGYQLGYQASTRWVISLLVAMLESFFIIEPIKVLLVAVYAITCSERPNQQDQYVDYTPKCDMHEQVQKRRSRIKPPAGFALEKCKEEALKSRRLHQLLQQFVVHVVLLWSLLAFVFWDRDSTSYWSHKAIKDLVFRFNHSLNDVTLVDHIVPWLNGSFLPCVLYGSSPGQDSPTFSPLLGKIRLRQQLALPVTCDVERTKYSALMTYPNDSCIPTSWEQDKDLLFSGSDLWSFQHPSSFGFAYFGSHGIYDDSGYFVDLDPSSWESTLASLQSADWLSRSTRVVILEFTHLNPATYWFIVSTIFFEPHPTGFLSSSYQSSTSRLFRPSSALYLDIVFIVFFALIGIFLWVKEIKKLYLSKSLLAYLRKNTNWINLFVNFNILLICILFIIKEVKVEEAFQNHLSNRNEFTSFYQASSYSNLLTYLSSFLLAILMAKVVRLLRFVQGWSKFGETYARCTTELLNTTLILLLVVTTYSVVAYLIFGIGSTHSIPIFSSFASSFISIFSAFRHFSQFKVCFQANPAFSAFFFISYFLIIFIIITKLFAAVVMEALRNTNDHVPMMRKLTSTIDAKIPNYFLRRLKLRFGIIKVKQVTLTRLKIPTNNLEVHSFVQMYILNGYLEALLSTLFPLMTPSTLSSIQEQSLNARMFQVLPLDDDMSVCDVIYAGLSVSSSDSGIGTPSDHSISVYDYLTLGEVNDNRKPMDRSHLEHLYARLESYSVDMMLRKVERVNKLSDEVLAVERDLLEISESTTRWSKPPFKKSTNRVKKSDVTPLKRFHADEDAISRLNVATIASAAKQSVRRCSTRSANAVIRHKDCDETTEADTKSRRRPYSDEGARTLASEVPKTQSRCQQSREKAAVNIIKKTAW